MLMDDTLPFGPSASGGGPGRSVTGSPDNKVELTDYYKYSAYPHHSGELPQIRRAVHLLLIDGFDSNEPVV